MCRRTSVSILARCRLTSIVGLILSSAERELRSELQGGTVGGRERWSGNGGEATAAMAGGDFRHGICIPKLGMHFETVQSHP